jgi:hypothetical protein
VVSAIVRLLKRREGFRRAFTGCKRVWAASHNNCEQQMKQLGFNRPRSNPRCLGAAAAW